MSRYRVALFALIVSLAIPAAVRADALEFGFAKGIVAFSSTAGTGYLTNNPASQIGKAKGKRSTLNFVGAFPGGKSFSAPSLGTVQFTTGFALSGATNSLIQYAKGGSIIIKATKAFGKGVNKITPGSVLFTGSFTGTQNFAITQGKCKKCFSGVLTGNVGTTFANPHLLALLSLSPVAGGIFKSIEIDVSFGRNGGAVTNGFLIVTPEPGTLALAGTGLLSIAGLLRRKKRL